MKVQTTPLEMYQKDTYDECKGINPCILCGKEIGLAPKHYVHLLNTGDLISTDEDFEESMGFYPIGSECKKRIRSNFIFKK